MAVTFLLSMNSLQSFNLYIKLLLIFNIHLILVPHFKYLWLNFSQFTLLLGQLPLDDETLVIDSLLLFSHLFTIFSIFNQILFQSGYLLLCVIGFCVVLIYQPINLICSLLKLFIQFFLLLERLLIQLFQFRLKIIHYFFFCS